METQPHDGPVRRFERDDGFVARSATTADTPAILEVLQAAFPEWPPVPTDRSALEHLKWKMNPPNAGPSHHGLVEFDGRVVAVKLRWIGRSWLSRNEQVSDVGADMAVLQEFQGRGLGRLLNNLEERTDRPGGTISFERPSRQAAVRHMEVDRRAFNLRTWVRPLALRSHVSARLRAGGPVRLVRDTLARVRQPRGHPTAAILEVDRFDERVNTLWIAGRDRFDLARVRDAEQLNWRYADPRGGRCTILAAVAGDAWHAYGVFREAGSELRLLDLLTHPEHPDAGVAVLEAGIARLRAPGIRNLVAWLPPDHPDEPVYAAAGFLFGDDFPVDYKVPRGISAPEVALQLYRPDLRRDVTIGDFDFA